MTGERKRGLALEWDAQRATRVEKYQVTAWEWARKHTCLCWYSYSCTLYIPSSRIKKREERSKERKGGQMQEDHDGRVRVERKEALHHFLSWLLTDYHHRIIAVRSQAPNES
jgi:hypothetical protein